LVVYSLCSSSFCQGVKVVVVVQKDTHTFFFSSCARFLVARFFANCCSTYAVKLEKFLLYHVAYVVLLIGVLITLNHYSMR